MKKTMLLTGLVVVVVVVVAGCDNKPAIRTHARGQ
jgi:predicted small secreted protein